MIDNSNIPDAVEETSNPIGRVVMIPDEYTIVIEKLSNDIQVGDDIVIYEEATDVITPEGKNLGTFTYAKAQLKVVEVNPGFCVCKDIKVRRGTRIGLSISPLLDEITTKETNKLHVAEEDNLGLSLKYPKIRIGDLARFL